MFFSCQVVPYMKIVVAGNKGEGWETCLRANEEAPNTREVLHNKLKMMDDTSSVTIRPQ